MFEQTCLGRFDSKTQQMPFPLFFKHCLYGLYGINITHLFVLKRWWFTYIGNCVFFHSYIAAYFCGVVCWRCPLRCDGTPLSGFMSNIRDQIYVHSESEKLIKIVFTNINHPPVSSNMENWKILHQWRSKKLGNHSKWGNFQQTMIAPRVTGVHDISGLVLVGNIRSPRFPVDP